MNLGWPVTAPAPIIGLVQQELEAIGAAAGLCIFVHAARALAAIRKGAPPELGHVGAADEGR